MKDEIKKTDELLAELRESDGVFGYVEFRKLGKCRKSLDRAKQILRRMYQAYEDKLDGWLY